MLEIKNKEKFIQIINKDEIRAIYFKEFLSGKLGWLRKKSIKMYLFNSINSTYKLGYKLNWFIRMFLYLSSPATFLIYGVWRKGFIEFAELIKDLNKNEMIEKDTITKKEADYLLLNLSGDKSE